MSEEKEAEVVKEEVAPKKEVKKSKKAKVLIILLVTIIFTFLVVGIAGYILYGDKIFIDSNKGQNNITNVHRFTGQILFSQMIDNYSFVTEYVSTGEKVGNIVVNFLHRNVLVSNVVVAENIDISACSDYGIIFKDYNNDGMSDFSHIYKISDGKSMYRLYTLTKEGKLIRLDDKDYSFLSNKFSLGLDVKDGVYTYNEAKIYYDGYEIGLDTGVYELKGERNTGFSKVRADSKLSFSDNRNIELTKYEVTTTLTEAFYDKHSLLKRYNEVKVINIDLDGDEVTEKIVHFFDTDTKDTRIIVFDGEDEVTVNLVNVKGKKYELNDVVEFLDIDNDGVIELITKLPDSNEVTVSKYYLGYYFPKVEFN